MRSLWSGKAEFGAVAVLCLWCIATPASFAQTIPDYPEAKTSAPQLPPEALDNMVAPIALYPDPLLGQVLAASTYPLEIIAAKQWLDRNSNLRGADLMEAAKKQYWDPSVQALVAFPDALRLLSNDIQWTTDLGNAFLAQQADVMAAVQRMRARAQDNGKLSSTPQQVVTTNTQEGQRVVEIQPADPQVVYVPVYEPQYVYGPPVWGAYPSLWYPPGFGFGFGFGWGYPVYMGFYFPFWGGWGGWGWGCGWHSHNVWVNTSFHGHYGYHYGGYPSHGNGGHVGWTHDSSHRQGVPYSNQSVARGFAGGGHQSTGRGAAPQRSQQWGSTGGGNRMPSTGGSVARGSTGTVNRTPSTGGSMTRGFVGGSRSGNWPSTGSGSRSYAQSPAQSFRGSPSTGRSFSPGYSAPRSGGFSAPRSFSAPSRSFSAPPSFGGSRGFSGGSGFSGGHSGGFSGGHSGGFSGGHSGGGGGGHHR